MKNLRGGSGRRERNPAVSGFSLVEMAVSLGVLAVAVPLAFAAMGEAVRSGGEAAQDNRSTSILAACMDAVERAREGAPGWFEASPAGAPFPQEDEVWALAFGGDGKLLGRATREQYGHGVRRIGENDVGYLASLHATAPPDDGSAGPLLRLTITIEHPAGQPVERRKRSSFHSAIR